ncbi:MULTISPECIES: DUF3772 domain-containing protein [unclassified Chelatococcus]|uniref:DUF3772 domain-containing protein n=1 Tax=unclassified Chelatococcus TaxID=2638111 RepID=UPI001BCAAF65|nr:MULTISPECIES: DUF3772 domain-containing protein [unclassified Chelatococcus]CAH1659831.1 Potassium efflux system KefA protein / Small-conductance mechanosensitive channel [Hyphomicrobiales bacterium]MBS7740996.1 mechanosensitive ion channel family protein [Chelatococcus sp. HY11]MBX3545182.1 mechanosensitive ion channel family protein [Chelatococcus sp.]MCO5077815.1 DUF3772 domain-containing protein [Chelatococcus sp.]CAH1683682.1 Potassium efflux system KefA protein / Small-conductance mec
MRLSILLRSVPCRIAAIFLCLLVVGLGGLTMNGPALAQTPAQSQSAAGGQAESAQSRLDQAKLQLDQIEATLTRQDLSDDTLTGLRDSLEPIAVTISTIQAELRPRVDALKARLAQLGPAPEAVAGATAPPMDENREERDAQKAGLARAEGLVAAANALQVQAAQLRTSISDARRTLISGRILAKTPGIFSPALWTDALAAMPYDMRALHRLARDWAGIFAERVQDGRIAALVLPLLVGIGMFVLRQWLIPHLTRRDPEAVDVSQRKRVLVAIGIALGRTLTVAITLALMYVAMDGIGLLPGRIKDLAQAIFLALSLVVCARALADACFAPNLPSWRLFGMQETTARQLLTYVSTIAGLMLAERVIEALLVATSASLPSTILVKCLYLVAVVLVTLTALHSLRSPDEDEECALGPYVAPNRSAGIFKIAGWAAIAVVTLAVILGYVALAGFIVGQLMWAALVAAVIYLAIQLVAVTIGAIPRDKRMASAIHANIGLSYRSLEQFSVLAGGLINVTLILLGFLLVLAPFGVESNDIIPAARQALVGFTIGEVTISLSAIMIAVLTFIVIIAAIRAVQSWLSGTFLPTTELESGIRNSITTAVGYLGFFIAAMVALSQLGLSLANVAIVAGALSVGIGLGLQSIVNNFVSGLILLWERSIRVGDWVVVGADQGHVRRISVRATEIETFDRAAVIVPNSNLVSGVVKNWVHNGRSGRFTIKVGVSYTADADEIRDLLLSLAAGHAEVLRDPPPRVFLTEFGEKAVNFDLHGFVADVATSGRIKSEISFKILRELKARDALPPR